ncbi:hypothetical protein ACOSQ3_015096 [Xanthoceras sorbifolium]
MRGYKAFESRMSTLKDILSALSNPNIDMVGVYGQSGIGKTMLVKEVFRQAKVKKVLDEKLFDEIVFMEISEPPNIRDIQGEIADKLGLEFHSKSDPGRARELHARLKRENKILLILDNISRRLNLEKVGIPFGDDHKGCKLLLTTRNEDVLSNKMDSQNNFCIDILNEKEAWSLFKSTAGDCTENKDLQSLPIDIAKACGGVPSVIVKKARELKNKQVYEWKNALVELRRASLKSFTGAGKNYQ